MYVGCPFVTKMQVKIITEKGANTSSENVR
jgi:hypothetical protein